MRSVVIKSATRPDPLRATSLTAASTPYPFRDCEAAIMANSWAKLCMDDVARNTVGRGFALFPQKMQKFLTRRLLMMTDKDMIKGGNAYWEVVSCLGEITGIYRVSPDLVTIKEVKLVGNSYQKTFLVGTAEFSEFTGPTDSKSSTIFHFLNPEESEWVGSPYWIAVREKMRQNNSADRYNTNYLDKDCVPDGIIWTKGEVFDEETEENIEEMFDRHRGPVERSRLLSISMEEGGECGFIPLSSPLKDGSFLALSRDNVVATCAAFGVPPKKVGYETPGKLGDSSDFTNQLNGYYEDLIVPRQEYYEEEMTVLFGEVVKFNRPPLSKVEEESGTVQKGYDRTLFSSLVRLREEFIHAAT